jgi:hypothetical protein
MAGKIIADTLEHSTAGSLDTSYVVNGSAKAWNRFVGGSIPTLLDSLNNSTAIDNGTGDYTFAFINTMNNANYAPDCGGGRNPATSPVDGRVQNPDQITTSNFVYNMYSINSDGKGAYIDDGIGLTVVHGDLA